MDCLDHQENQDDRVPQELTESQVKGENEVSQERLVVLAFLDPLD